MKVKIFGSAGDSLALEKEVNEFIKDKHVIDIKYTTTFVINKYGTISDDITEGRYIKKPRYDCPKEKE